MREVDFWTKVEGVDFYMDPLEGLANPTFVESDPEGLGRRLSFDQQHDRRDASLWAFTYSYKGFMSESEAIEIAPQIKAAAELSRKRHLKQHVLVNYHEVGEEGESSARQAYVQVNSSGQVRWARIRRDKWYNTLGLPSVKTHTKQYWDYLGRRTTVEIDEPILAPVGYYGKTDNRNNIKDYQPAIE